MPTITIPTTPVPAKEPFISTVVYDADQAPQYARQDIVIQSDILTDGDYFLFNGVAWNYSPTITAPTDFVDAESFVVQFNSNPDYNLDYEAVVTNAIFGVPTALNVRVTAKETTSQLNITAESFVSDLNAILIGTNISGSSAYSKNDVFNFAQLARVAGTTNDNEQVNTDPTYIFELSSQIQGQLQPFKIEDGTGVVFKNEGAYKDLQIEFGTRFSATEGGYRIKRYDVGTFDITAYLGEYSAGGLLTNRTGAKITTTELYEADSFLVDNYTDVSDIKRKITVTYTDDTTQIILDGQTGNPINGIVSILSGADSFSYDLDNAKTVRSWIATIATPGGDDIYQGQEYINRLDLCIDYLQILFTNEYGGFEVFNIQAEPTYSYIVNSSSAKESRLPNEYREFNFVTEEIETISIEEQAIKANEYEILKGLLTSKYVYLYVEGQRLPVRVTANNLTNKKFNASFKCLG